MPEAIFLLCTGVTLASAVIASFAAHKCSERKAEVARLVRALSDERSRIAAHDAELDQITGTLRKLSGRIGAVRKEARQSEEASAPEFDRLTWKAKMRERYGIVPRAIE